MSDRFSFLRAQPPQLLFGADPAALERRAAVLDELRVHPAHDGVEVPVVALQQFVRDTLRVFPVEDGADEHLPVAVAHATFAADEVNHLADGLAADFLAQAFDRRLGVQVPDLLPRHQVLALTPDEADECEFICKDVLKTDINALIKGKKIEAPDCIIVDPPRKGLDIGVVKKIMELGAPEICYISCDPATLARDLKMLSREYRIEEITPVDLFPNASHVETVVLLSR